MNSDKVLEISHAAVLGLDNRRPEARLNTEEGTYLRAAVNVDLTNTGTPRRRAGYARALVGADCHSFWCDGADAFMVDGSDLLRIAGLPYGTATRTTLRTGLMPGRPVSYARTPNGVYYGNGIVLGRIDKLGARPACTPALATAPSAAAVAGGSLPAGRYGLCFTHLDAAGEESASTTPIWLDVPAGNLICVTNMPGTFPTGAAATVMYLTLPNDSTLQRAATFTSAAATYDLAVMPWTLGARCQTVLRQPLPAGDIVRFHSGRLLSAKGPLLCYSEPYMLGLFNSTAGYIQFPSDITIVEPTPGGVWICADKTYWFAGNDIATAQPDERLPYSGVPGSGGTVADTTDVFWMSPRGMVRASQDGSLKNLQEEHVAIGPVGFSAGFFRETDGRKQMAESTFAAEPNRMAAASYMEAEISRKAVTL